MYQAITTKYLPPTNYLGSRVRAKAQAGTIIKPWDYSLDADDNHMAAARQLAQQLEWWGRWVGGSLPSGDGNVFVLTQWGEGQSAKGFKV